MPARTHARTHAHTHTHTHTHTARQLLGRRSNENIRCESSSQSWQIIKQRKNCIDITSSLDTVAVFIVFFSHATHFFYFRYLVTSERFPFICVRSDVAYERTEECKFICNAQTFPHKRLHALQRQVHKAHNIS